MSVSLFGSRYQGAVCHVSCRSATRLRLPSGDYAERLLCRQPVVQRKDFSVARQSRPPQTLRASYARLYSQPSSIDDGPHHPTRQLTTSPSHHNAHPSPTSSVSPSEVSHFSRLASTWWDPHGPSRLLHLMNPLRHDFIRSCLTTPPPPSSLTYLDIGCGGGIFSTSCALHPSTEVITAIDPTPACIHAAKAHARSDPALSPPPDGKLTYLETSIEDLPSIYKAKTLKEFEQVDIITLFEVIEHIDHPSTFLSACLQHLKSGGWLIGSTIARSPVSYFTTKLIAEAPIVGVVPRGTHDWNKYINPSELREYFETKAEGKWSDFRVQGVVYLPMIGWKTVEGSERFGNYFFGVQKLE